MSKEALKQATNSTSCQESIVQPGDPTNTQQEDTLSQAEESVIEEVIEVESSDGGALAQAQQALKEADDKYMRLYAEFENFRRREAKERLARIAAASQGVLEKLLPVVDDFERALQALQVDTAAQEGIRLIYDKLTHLLHQEGVQPMELAPGASFDAELHEAITQAPTEDPEMKGRIIDVVSKGYVLRDKVLRFAKVVIGA
ncbi:MAG: nucleotide exchange factor GrpE [Bacteroidota bacterium]